MRRGIPPVHPNERRSLTQKAIYRRAHGWSTRCLPDATGVAGGMPVRRTGSLRSSPYPCASSPLQGESPKCCSCSARSSRLRASSRDAFRRGFKSMPHCECAHARSGMGVPAGSRPLSRVRILQGRAGCAGAFAAGGGGFGSTPWHHARASKSSRLRGGPRCAVPVCYKGHRRDATQSETVFTRS